MSDDERSDSSSEGEDLNATGLIATRAKRSTAGNLYATLRANLDDEELQKELLAEDEEDQGEYQGSDRDDDDAAMDSSSDEEDTGPPKEGEQEDLEGEKELKRKERAEAKRKRKMDEAKMRIPAFARAKKRVKLADDAKDSDGSVPPKPKKKSERSNWLPTAADAPLRQSSRSAAVANREVVHANLKESLVRSEKQKKVMADHQAREQFKKRMEYTQEERLAKTARVEKETAREFGRWEREEAERERIREEQLAAKRRRGLDGPVIRYWSGSVLWEGDKIKLSRLHGSQKIEDIVDEANGDLLSSSQGDPANALTDFTAGKLSGTAANSNTAPSTAVSGPGTPGLTAPQNVAPPAQNLPAPSDETAHATEGNEQPPAPTGSSTSWLFGIEQYAAQQPQSVPTSLQPSPYMPSAPGINGTSAQPSQYPPISPYPPLASQPDSAQQPPSQPQVYHGWSSSYTQFDTSKPQTQASTAPPPPIVREQAQRSLVILEQFENLEVTTTGRKSKAPKEGTTDPSPLAAALMPESYPSFTLEESKYLFNPKRKKTDLPAAPAKTKCALTSWPAKFRDPRTGLAYYDLHQYKMIQRMVMGGCQWSSLLGAWAGPAYDPECRIGRPATGVPEGFGAPVTGTGRGSMAEAEADMKMENAG